MPDFTPRGRVIRDAAIYTPIFAGCSLLLLAMIAGIVDRAPIGMVLLAGVTFLFGYQSIQSLRDLRKSPQPFEGVIARRWTKRDGFVVKSHYVSIEKTIFRIPVECYLDVKKGDVVRILAYPHTGTVVSVERTGRPEPEEPPAPTGPAPAKGRMRTLRTARLTPSDREEREQGTGNREQ